MEPEIGLVFLVAVPAGLLGSFGAYAALRRGPEDTWLVAFLRGLNDLLMHFVHRLRVLDREGEPLRDALPRTGGFIVVANHRSGADPNIVGGTTRRWISFLMAREYYETTGLEWLFRHLRAIPVNRDGTDMSALRRAIAELRAGRVVGLFPQGGIREPDELDVAKAGVALLAAKSGVPVVPLYIDGSPIDESVFKVLFIPSRTRVYCGDPIVFEGSTTKRDREALETFTNRILAGIAQLREVARRQHGDREAREPESAGSGGSLAHEPR